jgi:hypothetical protein
MDDNDDQPSGPQLAPGPGGDNANFPTATAAERGTQFARNQARALAQRNANAPADSQLADQIATQKFARQRRQPD